MFIMPNSANIPEKMDKTETETDYVSFPRSQSLLVDGTLCEKQACMTPKLIGFPQP